MCCWRHAHDAASLPGPRPETPINRVRLPAPEATSQLPTCTGAEEGVPTRLLSTGEIEPMHVVGAKLKALHGRRDDLEAAIDDLLDPLVAPSMPAFDIAVLLLLIRLEL